MPSIHKIQFNLTGPEFDQESYAQAWPHTHTFFQQRLKALRLTNEWAELSQGLARRHLANPRRPHTVYEAFLRGKYGCLVLIIAVTSPEGQPQFQGLLYRVAMNLEATPEARLNALRHLVRKFHHKSKKVAKSFM